MPSQADIVKDYVSELSRLQDWMIPIKDKAPEVYESMHKRYVELKVVLSSMGVNLAELDRIKEQGGRLEISPVSKAQQKATKEWEKRNYDSVNLRLPKGTKERIKNVSETVNGFIVSATLEKLEKEESEEK